MKQEVVFNLVDHAGKVLQDIEAQVEWENDGEFDVAFYDRQVGYQTSNPASAYGNWTCQDPDEHMNIRSLINAVQHWDDWTESLSWIENCTDVFTFLWTGEYEGFADMEGRPEYKSLERIT